MVGMAMAMMTVVGMVAMMVAVVAMMVAAMATVATMMPSAVGDRARHRGLRRDWLGRDSGGSDGSRRRELRGWRRRRLGERRLGENSGADQRQNRQALHGNLLGCSQLGRAPLRFLGMAMLQRDSWRRG